MSQTKLFMSMALVLSLVANANAAIILDLIETGDNPVADLTAAFVAGSGLTVVAGSETFVGRVGNGNLAQSATYSGFNLVPNVGGLGLPTISQADGILLTSGQANTSMSNTSSSFSGITSTGGDADLSTLSGSNTRDTNSFSFDFTVPAGITSIALDFVFASDEFPDQGVTDVFGVFVDGTNFAFFQDGSLVSFVQGSNAANFNDNNIGTGNYDSEYDGISNSLSLVGILDPTRVVHSLKLAIADTNDSVFDSAVYIAGFQGGTATGGGGIDPPGPGVIPEPVSALVWGGLVVVGSLATRRRRSQVS